MDDSKMIEPCGLSRDEQEAVKSALLDLIEECRGGGNVGEDASVRLEAVARGTEALTLLAAMC